MDPRPRRAADWTKAEERRLRDGIAAGVGLRELHDSGVFAAHRTLQAVRSKASVLGVSPTRRPSRVAGRGLPVILPPTFRHWIRQRARERRVTMAEIVRRAIAAAMASGGDLPEWTSDCGDAGVTR